MMIPQKIKVGYQNRESTYTGKLAYVIYYDEKGKLRKEPSWRGWCDASLGDDEFDNVPMEGFVLNKKVGGYKSGWNFRGAYTRVFHPNGFEFEISVDNLLYILEHCDSIKGKGLQGEFVCAFEGKDIVLLPVDAPDYAKYKAHSDNLFNPQKITTKGLVIGNTYLHKNKEKRVYLGRHADKKGDKYHIFVTEGNLSDIHFTKGATGLIMDLGDYNFENLCHYNMIFELSSYFNHVDYSKTDYMEITPELFVKAYNLRSHRDYNVRKSSIIGTIGYYGILESKNILSDDEVSERSYGNRLEVMIRRYYEVEVPNKYGWNRYKELPKDFEFTIEKAKKILDDNKYVVILKEYYENGNVHYVYNSIDSEDEVFGYKSGGVEKYMREIGWDNE